MSKQNQSRISTFGSQVTSIISVSLVLMILGMVALIGLVSKRITNDIRHNMGFVIEVSTMATEAEINDIGKLLDKSPFVASYKYVSAQDILEQESAAMGEDVLLILEENPYNPEFDVKVTTQYASADSIESIRHQLLDKKLAIQEVLTQALVIDRVNSNLDRVMLILVIVGIALLIISFVLINNTVSLSIYSQRFLIYTMKLVGATASFIRRPFVGKGAVNGLMAGIISAIVICALVLWLKNSDSTVNELISWVDTLVIVCADALIGVCLCSAAAWVAATRYLNAHYDKLFRS